MATTYVGPKAGAGVQPHDFKAGGNLVTATFDLATAIDATNGGGTGSTALIINDVIQIMKVPKGARVCEMVLTVTDLDAGTNIVLAVGDGVDDDRYISGSTIGQTGGTVRLGSGIITNTSAFTYTADDTIDVKVTTAGSAVTTGTITLSTWFSTDL